MGWNENAKIRSEETWAEVRRAWERGETGASLAQRYDVGLANLWRRRASEAWERNRPEDPVPEPVEGWERAVQRKLHMFEFHLQETRALAVKLIEGMQGGPLKDVPLWHLPFVLAWREARLDAAALAADRAYMEKYAWADDFWDEAGRLKNTAYLDSRLLMGNRALWREDYGIPEGVAPYQP